MDIGDYSINGYWLMVAILLMVIDDYSNNGYW